MEVSQDVFQTLVKGFAKVNNSTFLTREIRRKICVGALCVGDCGDNQVGAVGLEFDTEYLECSHEWIKGFREDLQFALEQNKGVGARFDGRDGGTGDKVGFGGAGHK